MRVCELCAAAFPPSEPVCRECGHAFAMEVAHAPAPPRSAPAPAQDALEAGTHEGSILDGRYVLEEPLGRRGLGEVFAARHVALGRPVRAVVLPATLDAAIVARLERELRDAARLVHPNAQQVLDLGTTRDGGLWFVTEHVPGRDLDELLRAEFPLDEARTCRLVAQVLAALGAAHRAGLAHGALGTGDVLVGCGDDEADFVKVVDVGLARILAPGERRPADPRSDLFAAGAILYRMVTGVLPFDRSESLDGPARGATRAVPPLRRRPDARCSPRLEALVVRALDPDPRQRPQGADEFRRGLLAIETSVRERPPGPAQRAELFDDRLELFDVRAIAPAPEEAPHDAAGDARRQREAEASALAFALAADRRDRQRAAVLAACAWLAALAVLAIAAVLAEPHVPRDWPVRVWRASERAIAWARPPPVPPPPAPTPPPEAPIMAVREEPPHPIEPALAERPRPPRRPAPKPLLAIAPGAHCPDDMRFVDAGAFRFGPRTATGGGARPTVVETGAYCIDVFEHPNAEGSMPTLVSSWSEAEAACRATGRRLCTEAEWERACKGPEDRRFGYGDVVDASACNTAEADGAGRALEPSGQRPRCASALGVIDLVGNAAEWVAPAADVPAEVQVLRGGSAARAAGDARCATYELADGSTPGPLVGFRCCADAR